MEFRRDSSYAFRCAKVSYNNVGMGTRSSLERM